MKFNLKNRPTAKFPCSLENKIQSYEEWFEGFEQELRNMLVPHGQVGEEGMFERFRNNPISSGTPTLFKVGATFCPYVMIKEVLGE